MILHVVAGIALVLISYFMGAIPFAIVIGKGFWHVDVRDHGSGNVGTTNVFRVLGVRAGTLVLVGDMAKGFIPVSVAVHFFPTWFALIVALAALLGHMYSVFLRGGGGKGVATGAGIVLALVPWIFIIALGVFLVLPAHDAHGERGLDGGGAHLCRLHVRLRQAGLVQDPCGLRRAGRHLSASLQHQPHRPALREQGDVPLGPPPWLAGLRTDRRRRA